MTDPLRPLVELAIVVVNYGSHELLRVNLVTSAAEAQGASVIVVDNYSSDAERDAVRVLSEEQGWTLVESASNLGFGSAVNCALDRLGPETTTVLILNPDASIAGPAMRRLADRVASRPLDLVAPTLMAPDGSVWSAGTDLRLDSGQMRSWRRRPENDTERTQPWLSGACLMLSRVLWDRIGGFDDDYFLYWEDVDLSRRALAVGADLVVDPDAHAVHDEGGTHGHRDDRAKSPIYYYYNTRNRLLFAAKHLTPQEQRRWRRSAPWVAYRILLQGGRRQFVRPTLTIVPAWKGTRDGRRLMRSRQFPSGTARPR